MNIKRDFYLQQLIDRRENGLVKVICGLRRSGKSFLLFNLFKGYLLQDGVKENQIISLSLDEDVNDKYRDPAVLSEYIRSCMRDSREMYYLFLDEIQFAISREELGNNDKPVRLYGMLNGLMHLGNIDIYVTGSNSKMLSKDVLTEFRGRGDVVNVSPLSFREYYGYVGGDRVIAFEDYARYGGMPLCLSKKDEFAKSSYLIGLFDEVFHKDIQERYAIELPDILGDITDALCSSVGSLTNATRIANIISSVKKQKTNEQTIAKYLNLLTDSFLFRCAKRFDIKGNKYFEYPMKYYCADIGLRNARLNWRQQEESHIMENIIYNELIVRGNLVDVGIVPIREENADGKRVQSNCEIDFVVNRGMRKYYIQSCLNMEAEEKQRQELRPLLAVKDMFRKIVVTKTSARPWYDAHGILHLGIYDFLLDEKCLDT